MQEFFTYEKFKAFLHYMKRISKVTSFANWDGSKAIVLRHDVDIDIFPAYTLSLIEKECGVESTFFIMTTCPTYNPLSLENRKLLSEMTNNGFEIGLHFDPTVYGDIPLDEMQDKVEVEASILESIIGKKVKSISLHNPSVHGQYPTIKGFHNAYDNITFTDETYLSDSCMDFRGKDPFEFVKLAKEKPIQVVLHPLHYREARGNNYVSIFRDYFSRIIEDIDIRLRAANRTYSALLGERKLMDLVIKGCNDV